METYPFPQRLANLTAYQLNLWDVLYCLAVPTGGRILVSTAELVHLTGIPRQKISPLLSQAMKEGMLRKETGFLLDAPTGWHYVLRLLNYPRSEPMIYKPTAYVRHGWVRTIRLAVAKRLINYLLLQGKHSFSLEEEHLGEALRAPWAEHPLSTTTIRNAVECLLKQGVLTQESEGWYAFHVERFERASPAEGYPAWLQSAMEKDPLRAERAMGLVRKYHLSEEEDFSFVFDLLERLRGGEITWLHKALREYRNEPLPHRHEAVRRMLQQHASPGVCWSHLRGRAWALTHKALEPLRERVDPRLAVSRHQAEKQWHEFLNAPSPAPLLAVIGPAGTGKTTLLGQWAIASAQAGHAVLLLTGRMIEAPASMSLRSYFPLLEELIEHGQGFRKEGWPQGGYLLLMVDAINEAPNPLDLLQSLLRLHRQLESWPVRIVLSCRDIRWRQWVRQVHLPAQMVQTIRLNDFDEEEFRQAYSLYQQRYHIAVPLTHLPQALHSLLRHPLFLSLFAQAHARLDRDSNLSQGHPIGYYLDALLDESEARTMLVSAVRQMAREHCTSLPRSRLWGDSTNAHLTRAYTLLLESRLLSEGWRKGEVRVWITYEQVGEYLLGKYVLPENLTREDVVAYLEESLHYPAFWGALVQRLSDFPLGQLEQWAGDEVPYLRALVRDVLIVRHRQRERKKVEGVVRRLIEHGTLSSVNVGLRVAVERGCLPAILRGLEREDSAIREQAALHLYYLWHRLWKQRDEQDITEAWQVFHRLAKESIGRFGRFNAWKLKTLLWLSLTVGILHFDEEHPTDLYSVIGIWESLLRKGLKVRRWWRPVILPVLLRVGEQVMQSILKAAPMAAPGLDSNNSGQGIVLDILYRMAEKPEGEKQFLGSVLERMDEGTLFDSPDEVLSLVRTLSSHFFTAEWGMAVSILTLYEYEHPSEALKIINELLQGFSSYDPTFQCAASAILIPKEKEFYRLARQAWGRMWEELRTDTPLASINFSTLAYQEMAQGLLLNVPDWLMSYSWAKDDPRAALIVIETLELIAIYGAPLPALKSMRRFIKIEHPLVREQLINILARLRVLFEDEVNDFLDSAAPGLRVAVEALSPPTVMWRIATPHLWVSILRMAQHVPAFRHFVIRFIHRMLMASSASGVRKEAILYIIEYLLRNEGKDFSSARKRAS